MKKRFYRYGVWACSVLGLALSACSGSDDGSAVVPGNNEVYLRCKINGELRQFNHRANANDGPSEEKVHYVVISGWEGADPATSPGFGISLVSPEGAVETTYEVAGGEVPELEGKYFYQNYENGQNVGTTVYSGGRTDGTRFKLTITSLTKWGVKGTFSGLLRPSAGSELLQVTDGEFSAPYNYQ